MENLYQAPAAKLVETATATPFFVTSIRKLVVLHVATFGIYPVYWFYRHWKAHRVASGENLWPVGRAIFQVFFTHSLGRAIAKRLTDEGHERWDYKGAATCYVVALIAATVVGRIVKESLELDLLLLGITLASVLPLVTLQRKANLACDDEFGQANGRFTLANLPWLVLGAIIWPLALIGFFTA